MKFTHTKEYQDINRRLEDLEEARTIHYTTTTTCQVKDPMKEWHGPENEPAVNFKPLSFIKNSIGEKMYLKQHSEEVWHKKAEDDARKDFEREQKAFYEHIMFTKELRSCYVNREKVEQIIHEYKARKNTAKFLSNCCSFPEIPKARAVAYAEFINKLEKLLK